MNLSEEKKRVQRYYKASTDDYLKYYATAKHHHMHYGFSRNLPSRNDYPKGHPMLSPTGNLVRYLAQKAQISKGTRVLDAGCGVGGSSILLAKEFESLGVGLNFVTLQLDYAKKFAQKANVSQQLQWVCSDFHHTPFPNNSFDVVWAVESFCHSGHKKEWVREMFRVLKPGGRLIIADGFQSDLQTKNIWLNFCYKWLLKGWALPHLSKGCDTQNWFKEAGFANVECEDISEDVIFHAFKIYRFSFIFVPIRWLLKSIKLGSSEKLGNALATLGQYPSLKAKMWFYEIHLGTKPQ